MDSLLLEDYNMQTTQHYTAEQLETIRKAEDVAEMIYESLTVFEAIHDFPDLSAMHPQMRKILETEDEVLMIGFPGFFRYYSLEDECIPTELEIAELALAKK